jgi:hypothetical protein
LAKKKLLINLGSIIALFDPGNKNVILVTQRKHRYFSITPRVERLFMSPKAVKHYDMAPII